MGIDGLGSEKAACLDCNLKLNYDPQYLETTFCHIFTYRSAHCRAQGRKTVS